MKFKFNYIIFFILCFGCIELNSKQVYMPKSSGNLNDLLLVVNDDLWEGNVGDAVRNYISSEIYGLPQQEPYFDIRQLSGLVFKDFVRLNRIILQLKISQEKEVKFYTDPYASPQKMIVVSAPSEIELIELIKDRASDIISNFRTTEFNEKQRRVNKSLFDNSVIKQKLGIEIKFSTAYRIAKAKEDFFWIRRDIENGSLNLLIYSLPLIKFKNNSSFQDFIIKSRDSISKIEIPGPVEGNYMKTEKSYRPFSFKTELSNLSVFQTKSLWKVEGAFMSGPFVNYCFTDNLKDRLLIADGFVYAPAKAKRDYMFELETIIRSIKFE